MGVVMISVCRSGCRTGKKTETEPDWTGRNRTIGCRLHPVGPSIGCRLLNFGILQGPVKNRLQPVATSLSVHILWGIILLYYVYSIHNFHQIPRATEF